MRTRTAQRWQPGRAELVEPEKARFRYTCLDCGHRWTDVFMQGPRGNRKPNPEGAKILARVWRGYGRMNVSCPRCRKNGPPFGPRIQRV